MSKRTYSTINHIVGFLLLSIFLTYFILSIISIIQNSSDLGIGGIFLNLLSLFLELIGPIYILYFLVQVIDGCFKIGEIQYDISKVTEGRKVSVIIPIHNVPPSVLEETLKGFDKQSYANTEIWVGDDSTDYNLRKKCEVICGKYNVNYFYAENYKLKAGMLNLVIPKTEGDYIAFFDVDHIPTKHILTKFVSILEEYPEYEFIQAKYAFRNVRNLLHIWSAISVIQIFCSQNARRTFGAVLFQGSSACFRRSGASRIPENELIEDFSHSIELMSKGKKGYFLDEVGASTLLPDTLEHQMSQLYRWIKGETSSFITHFKNIFGRKMTFRKSIDIFFSSTVSIGLTILYELGIAYGLLYVLKVPIYRALGIDALSLLIMPILIFTIYGITLTATTIYFRQTKFFPLKFWHVFFYLFFSSFAAPYLKIAAYSGIFSSLLSRKRKIRWNIKVPILKWGFIFMFVGLIFVFLTIYSLLEYFNLISFYGTNNYFFILFMSVGFSLVFIAPFFLLTRNLFKSIDFREEHIFH
jgi:cellulose synthase/poly-beta-1,6-N-acetylglucosamine synthase-like glycosyltransferase